MTRFKSSSNAWYCLAVIALMLSAQAITTNAAHAEPTIVAHDNAKRAQVLANFQAADGDKNAQLDVAEFKTFINLNADKNLGQASSIRRFGMYAKAFKKVDANADGVVTIEEIAAQTQQ